MPGHGIDFLHAVVCLVCALELLILQAVDDDEGIGGVQGHQIREIDQGPEGGLEHHEGMELAAAVLQHIRQAGHPSGHHGALDALVHARQHEGTKSAQRQAHAADAVRIDVVPGQQIVDGLLVVFQVEPGPGLAGKGEILIHIGLEPAAE